MIIITFAGRVINTQPLKKEKPNEVKIEIPEDLSANVVPEPMQQDFELELQALRAQNDFLAQSLDRIERNLNINPDIRVRNDLH
jgi:hypothetical protein